MMMMMIFEDRRREMCVPFLSFGMIISDNLLATTTTERRRRDAHALFSFSFSFSFSSRAGGEILHGKALFGANPSHSSQERRDAEARHLQENARSETIHGVYVLPLFRAVFEQLQRMGDVCGRRFLVVGRYERVDRPNRRQVRHHVRATRLQTDRGSEISRESARTVSEEELVVDGFVQLWTPGEPRRELEHD
tara:strand:+ start:390 stop:968 length:579 start_codon:yes stop_codon:yes gene_type:complete